MLETILAFGLIQAIVLLIAFLYVLYCAATDQWSGVTAAFFIVGVLSIWFSAPIFGILVSIWNNPALALLYAFFYLVIGVLWSFYRWYLYCKVLIKTHQLRAKNYEKSYASKYDIPDHATASDHLDKITGWICWWPFSLITVFFSDMIRKFIRSIAQSFGKVYTKIAEKVFATALKNS